MKIGFHDNSLNIRGTSVAVYDYAYYNQTILGNESVIFYNINCGGTDNSVVEKFKTSFRVIPYNNFSDIDSGNHNLDALYIIKAGEINHQILNTAKTLVHSVFMQPEYQVHGDRYAFVSEWLSNVCSQGRIPFVPHMINLPNISTDLRYELSIPKSAIVFGRYGGDSTFDISFVKSSIDKSLTNKSFYFLFMNTPKFIEHERVIFLDPSSDLVYKTKFINTCDAMIHARHQGESFGIAVLEFASRNKQIITYGNSSETSHLQYLNGNCHVYNSEQDLDYIFNNFEQINSFDTRFLADKFSPTNVMTQFYDVFLKD